MKRFNPEKELYKIQHGNKNKIYMGIILLLLIISIGSTYALYQVRYSKRIIYTKVAPFNNFDIELSVYLDDIKTNDFPTRESGYYFNGIKCETEGVTTATWDYNIWGLNLASTKPNKCNVNFTKSPSLLTEKMKYMNDHRDELLVDLIDDDPKKNIRYIGADPDNYIWFNCKSYEDLNNENATDETHDCEKWRIIGLINNVTLVNGYENTANKTEESLVKVVNIKGLGNMPVTTETTNWSDGPLQASLNNDYLNGQGSYNVKSITPDTKGKIEKVRWLLGQTPEDAQNTLTVYNNEMNQSRYWDGNIALIYASDYGYATSGSLTMNRNSCLSTALSIWNNYTSHCAINDWLMLNDGEVIYPYVLTPSTRDHRGYVINNENGLVARTNLYANYGVYISLYLKSNIEVTGGLGTFEKPYTIK